MVKFTTVIKQFGAKGEKTGWSYIDIPEKLAQLLKPDTKKSFRVKGKLDQYSFKAVALIPMGEGDFILAVNAVMRKAIRKTKGASISVQLQLDEAGFKFDNELMKCLKEEPDAMAFFDSLPGSHRNYFSKWISSAKTEPTKTKRIAQTITAFLKKQGFTEMSRALKEEKKQMGK